MSKPIRAFVAAELNDLTRREARKLIQRLQESPAKVKWTEAGNLHLTLKFLGDITLERIPEISEALQKAAAKVEPFAFELVGAGAFPRRQAPRTVWIGVQEGSEDLVHLHQAVENELRPLGFRSEGRRYTPHVTIGRVRQSPAEAIAELGRLLAGEVEVSLGSVSIDRVVLFSSQLRPSGAVYEELADAELGA